MTLDRCALPAAPGGREEASQKDILVIAYSMFCKDTFLHGAGGVLNPPFKFITRVAPHCVNTLYPIRILPGYCTRHMKTDGVVHAWVGQIVLVCDESKTY